MFQPIHVIDDSFDVTIFTPSELEDLHALVSSNKERMKRNRSVRFPESWSRVSRFALADIVLPKYAPPSASKFTMLEILGMHYQTKIPTKPEMPLCPTNTELCNYVHRDYIYRQSLVKQLKRQWSYQNKLSSQRANLKHHYEPELSRTVSRKMSYNRYHSIGI